jgi:hypothetical protein
MVEADGVVGMFSLVAVVLTFLAATGLGSLGSNHRKAR